MCSPHHVGLGGCRCGPPGAPPLHPEIVCCRVDAKGETKTFTAFWAVPTGVGRSRLMLRFVTNTLPPWLRIPTWIFSMATNAFVVSPQSQLSHR